MYFYMTIDERYLFPFFSLGFMIYGGMSLMIEHGVMSVRLERVIL
jgi:hypothetical protein